MGLTADEEDNVLTVGGHPGHNVSVVVQVPVNTSLKLSCINDGDILLASRRTDGQRRHVEIGVRAPVERWTQSLLRCRGTANTSTRAIAGYVCTLGQTRRPMGIQTVIRGVNQSSARSTSPSRFRKEEGRFYV
jgi:hypothetical protein